MHSELSRRPDTNNADTSPRSRETPPNAPCAARGAPGSRRDVRCANGTYTRGTATTTFESPTVPLLRVSIADRSDNSANRHLPNSLWPNLLDQEVLHAPAEVIPFDRWQAKQPSTAFP